MICAREIYSYVGQGRPPRDSVCRAVRARPRTCPSLGLRHMAPGPHSRPWAAISLGHGAWLRRRAQALDWLVDQSRGWCSTGNAWISLGQKLGCVVVAGGQRLPRCVCVCVCVCVSRHVAVAGGQAPAPALAAGTSVCACVWVSWGGSHVATGKPGSKLCCASVRLPQNEAVNPRRVSVRFPQSRALRFGGGAQRDSKGLTSLATQSSSPASSACTGVCECMCGGGGGGARMRVGA